MSEEDSGQLLYAPDKGIIVLSGDINDITCSSYISALKEMKGKKVLAIICSHGGMSNCGLAMAAKTIEHGRVTVDVAGVAYSASTDILLAAKHARMSKMGMLMFHEVSISSDCQALLKHSVDIVANMDIHNRMMDVLLQNKKITVSDFYKRIKNKEWYVGPKEALKFGFVQEVY